MVAPRWTNGPASLTLVRHGESVGNLADGRAREAAAEVLDLDERDADVELSPAGRDQAAALATWLEEKAPDDWRPTIALASPYRRAAETAQHALRPVGLEAVLDERLRERDLGVFDGLTGAGIRARHPDEAKRRTKVGKFYYQPPSGESWADVVMRVRSLLTDLRHGYDGERLWLFTHQAVIMAFRYALERLDEKELLDIDRTTPIPNASFTRFCRDGDRFELDVFADARAIDDLDAPVTHEDPQRGRGHDH
ncbi:MULTISPECIES: histidine phosphatase family protein [unclassified Nocardioides]|uniref:histidine phosphatase family protein n=1 Tax=Nocardioides sp. URHA0032 TaxID=1380388 RepID=UPI00048A6DA5|nr:histidine phosphatase family protein [Nocardioides sp. URHA0032]